MKLKKKFTEYVAAAFSGLWIRSHEHPDAIREISEVCQRVGWTLMTWDVDNGIRHPGADEPPPNDVQKNPVAAINFMRQFKVPGEADKDKTNVILVMRNLHCFLTDGSGRVINPVLLQTMQHAVEMGASEGKFLVVLSYDGVKLPLELEKQFQIIDHPLPDHDELYDLMSSVDEELKPPAKDSEEARLLIDAAAGFTRLEAEGAFALSVTRHQSFKADELWEIKEQALKKSGLLTLHKAEGGFDGLGGLSHLKEFGLKAFKSRHRDKRVRPRGIGLIGVPGTGKSEYAKRLGFEVGRPTLIMDTGALMGSLVGQTEEQTRRALNIVDAMAPCILFVDEIEKALAGTSGGEHDSGVGARMMGSLLTWLNDHSSDVFFIFTSNDVSRLPPELTRAERFDAMFFMDLPTLEQKEKIWQLYFKYFDLAEDQIAERPHDKQWTGAEIRACCRLAKLFDTSLIEASRQVVPVAVTSREKIINLRDWADGRCLSADYKGVFNKSLKDQDGDVASSPGDQEAITARRPRKLSNRPTVA